MKTQLDKIKFELMLSFSLNNRYKVKSPVGKTINVAITGNLRHQKTSFINQQVICTSWRDNLLNGYFIPKFLLM